MGNPQTIADMIFHSKVKRLKERFTAVATAVVAYFYRVEASGWIALEVYFHKIKAFEFLETWYLVVTEVDQDTRQKNSLNCIASVKS